MIEPNCYLFVGKYEEDGVSELVFLQHAVQLVAGLAHSLTIVAVHDKDESLRVLEVVAPQWSNLVLTSHVPHGKTNVLVLDCLHIEAFSFSKQNKKLKPPGGRVI